MTLLTLERMLQEAYLSSLGPEDEMTRDAWETIMAERSPTFKFWCLIRKYETLILIFVRAHRQRNVTFYMHVEVLMLASAVMKEIYNREPCKPSVPVTVPCKLLI